MKIYTIKDPFALKLNEFLFSFLYFEIKDLRLTILFIGKLESLLKKKIALLLSTHFISHNNLKNSKKQMAAFETVFLKKENKVHLNLNRFVIFIL